MRIISGIFKGKNLSFIKSQSTRPLKDSVKENIFNIILHTNIFEIEIENSNVLDLYSGIGSFGIECISRGAKKVTFVEKDNLPIKTLHKNLENLSIANKSLVVNDELKNFLTQTNKEKFDIIFLDPPFSDVEYVNQLKLIRKYKIYKKNHIVIIHRERNSFDDLSKIIKLLITREYGRSKIILGRF